MLATIQDFWHRIDIIFPLGTQVRPNVVNQIGARTVFVAVYAGAVEACACWISPKHVVWMGDTQAADRSEAARRLYATRPAGLPDRWYKENSREFRDKVITKGLLAVGAMIERQGLPTTSSSPRYALSASFAALFNPALNGNDFATAAEAWRSAHLSKTAIARIALARRNISLATKNVAITFPGGGGTVLPYGESPTIIQAVIEQFGPRFLGDPQVRWISDSRMKEAYKNVGLGKDLGLKIKLDKTLPDLIMVDMDPPGRPNRFLLLFCEAVASEGPIDALRQRDLLNLVAEAGLAPEDCAFLTAYLDKASPAYRSSAHELAWQSFAWFVSEPDCLLHLREPANRRKVADLL